MNQCSSTKLLVVLQQRHEGHRMGFDFFTTNNLRAMALSKTLNYLSPDNNLDEWVRVNR